VEPNGWRPLGYADVTGILRRGGTILGTTNHTNPLRYPTPTGVADRSAACLERFRELSLDGLVALGGDGTIAIAQVLHQRGMPIVCLPKTIDRDVACTSTTIGFDTAASVAATAVDQLHATAEAHHRIMVLEVMGRYAGWIALHAGIAGGADVILIPELPYDVDRVVRHLEERERRGARFSIVVAAEGATPIGGEHTVLERASPSAAERLGGIGARLAAELECRVRRESRCVVLGHLQRGADPTAFDRLLATRFGSKAVELITAGTFGTMVALTPGGVAAVALEHVSGSPSTVPLDSDTLTAARAVGIEFGEPCGAGLIHGCL
jgi:6-phosphofructokinase 1